MPTTLPARTPDHSSTLIIVAISSRIYVQAAVRAGFKVIAIDAFTDIDTQKLAQASYRLTLQDGRINGQQLLKIIDSLPLMEVCGLCYGAGFEDNPELLTQLQRRLPLLGNTDDSVRRSKDPQQFFAACARLGIPHPETRLTPPADSASWLQKSVGASGGAHVQSPSFATDTSAYYYQRQLAGQPMSCLFLADTRTAQVLGFNQQWQQGSGPMPYRYVGAVGGIKPRKLTKNNIINYINKLTQEFGLKGLNSLDYLDNNGQLHVLELNPRLSASLALYTNAQAELMRMHVQCCQSGSSSACLLPLTQMVADDNQAEYIVYAGTDVTISQQKWPDWVRDLPLPGTHIEADAPICSVTATAASVSKVKRLIAERVSALDFQPLN